MIILSDTVYLNNLKEGQRGEILSVPSSGSLYSRFCDLGIVSGTQIKCIRRKKGAAAYLVRQTVFALRDADTGDIIILPAGKD